MVFIGDSKRNAQLKARAKISKDRVKNKSSSVRRTTPQPTTDYNTEYNQRLKETTEKLLNSQNKLKTASLRQTADTISAQESQNYSNWYKSNVLDNWKSSEGNVLTNQTLSQIYGNDWKSNPNLRVSSTDEVGIGNIRLGTADKFQDTLRQAEIRQEYIKNVENIRSIEQSGGLGGLFGNFQPDSGFSSMSSSIDWTKILSWGVVGVISAIAIPRLIK